MTETTLFKKLKAVAFTPAGKRRFTITPPKADDDLYGGGDVRIGLRKANDCTRLCPLEAIAKNDGIKLPEGADTWHAEYEFAGKALKLDPGMVNRFIVAADNPAWRIPLSCGNPTEEDVADMIRLRRRILKTCGLTELKEVA